MANKELKSASYKFSFDNGTTSTGRSSTKTYGLKGASVYAEPSVANEIGNSIEMICLLPFLRTVRSDQYDITQ